MGSGKPITKREKRNYTPSYGRWESIELTEQNRKMIFLPRGFAHGFCTLSEFSEVIYKVDNYFSKDHDSGIIWNDTDLAINWPSQEPVLSEKDKKLMTFKEFTSRQVIFEDEPL
jgi:dTDP-4-dehydrorhamnose 3,5-epimerase